MPTTKRSWILVADAAHARIYLREARGGAVHAVPGTEFENPEAHGRSLDLGTDKPGRTQESIGGARHALAPKSDPHRETKRAFARRLAAFLEQAALDARYDRLVIVAPPPMLGDLRGAFGRHTAERLTAELGKDLTKLPPQDVVQHLAEAGKL